VLHKVWAVEDGIFQYTLCIRLRASVFFHLTPYLFPEHDRLENPFQTTVPLRVCILKGKFLDLLAFPNFFHDILILTQSTVYSSLLHGLMLVSSDMPSSVLQYTRFAEILRNGKTVAFRFGAYYIKRKAGGFQTKEQVCHKNQ
jgi:hypothetical protein